MGRQPKIGLDFWLRDVRLFRDPKLRRPRQEFGYLAPYVYECLLDILYGDKGYYIDYRGEERDNVLWQLLELTQGRYPVTVETLANVIDSLVASGLFSGDQYRRGFITSARAQKGYFSATIDRKVVLVDFSIWLLSEDEMRELNPSGKSFVLQSFISRAKNKIDRTENSIDRAESTQSREEQIRGDQNRSEDSREEQTRAENSRAEAADLTDLTEEVEKLIGGTLDANFRLEIKRLLSVGMTREIILSAATRTETKQPREPAAYLRRILQSYEHDGVFTEADLEAVRPAKPRNAAPSCKEPTGALQSWERDWLADIEAKRKARGQEAHSNG